MDEKRLKEYDIIIEGNQATWEMRLEGDIQGTYVGTFKFRCFLTPTQRLSAGREYRELLGSNPTVALEHEDNLAFSLSQLKQRVISAPPFWTSNGVAGDLPDESIIDAVLDAAIASEIKFKEQLKQKKADAIERSKKAAEKMLKLRDEEDADEGTNKAPGD